MEDAPLMSCQLIQDVCHKNVKLIDQNSASKKDLFGAFVIKYGVFLEKTVGVVSANFINTIVGVVSIKKVFI
jgi:uncharacterized protein (UPF0254 family)